VKALVKTKAEPGLWQMEVPEPKCGPTDILIRISKTAICGTDLHIFNWDEWSQRTIKTPRVIGHEFVGRVEELGSEVTGLKKGDRVSGEGHITCGYCRNCRAGKRHLCRNTVGVGVDRDGAFAEYLVIPAGNSFRIPESISDQVAAILDPFGNATHTTLSFDLVGEDVLITGAGPIGIMAAALARHVGARFIVVTDVNDYRLELAGRMGATRTVNVTRESLPDIQRELGMKEGFDVGLEMSGSPEALNLMLDNMNHGGRIAFLGIPAHSQITINAHDIIFKGLHIKGVYGREMFETWYKMSAVLQSGLDISPVITHTFGVDDFQEAFRIMNTGRSCKIILNWG
jgi:threonine 3-dehydrogenase